MDTVIPTTPAGPEPGWREVVWPREHGSWSLALEPLALALLVAPSRGGAALAVAAAAAFFVRRPLRTGILDARPERRQVARRAAVVAGAVAMLGAFASWVTNGTAWCLWLVPSLVAGACFLAFDLQKAGREQQAELAGTIAFAALPAAFAVLAGWTPAAAVLLGAVMLGRAVPSVLTVRAFVRARKTREPMAVLPVVLALLAAAGGLVLWRRGELPLAVAIWFGLFALRSAALGHRAARRLRPAQIGMAEAVLGIGFIVTVAAAWRT